MDKTTYPFQGIIPTSVLKDMSKSGSRQMDRRLSHGFIIKLRGATEYCCGRDSLLLSAGQVLYVAQGASYFIREVEPGYSIVVNFACTESPETPIEKLLFPQGFDISSLAEKLYNSWQKPSGGYSALSLLYELLAKTVSARESYISPREKHLLEPVMAFLQAHLTDPELPLENLAQLAGVSDVYLRRIFKKQYGSGPAAFITRQRICLAQTLLEDESVSISQVAVQVGYRDALYFSRLFKKQTGLSPTEYRRQHLNALF